MAELGILYIATLLVTISILLSGIAVGLGRAMGSRKIESLGYEELSQGVINGAMIGVFAAIIEMVSSVSGDAVKGVASCTPFTGADAASKLACISSSLSGKSFLLLQELIRVSNIIGYYQTLKLDFGAFAIQPLANLEAVSSLLSSQIVSLQFALVLLGLQLQIVQFISQNAVQFLFPLGLAFRSFFVTRKFGGFLVAISLALFILYPVLLLSFPSPEAAVEMAHSGAANFTSNSSYAVVPLIDLNGNEAIAKKIDGLGGIGYSMDNATNTTVKFSTGVDLTSDITRTVQLNTDALSKMLMFSIVAPIFSLIVSVLFIKEAGNILGGEMISISIIKNV